MSLTYFQTMPIYYLSGKYKLSVRSFFDYFTIFCASQKRMLGLICFGLVSTLNLTIIFIESCNNTIFSFWMKYYFSITYFLLNTPPSLTKFQNFMEYWLTDSPSIHKWYSFSNASISASYFNFCVSCTFTNKILANSLVWFKAFWFLIDLQNVLHFDSLILSNTFMCNFLIYFS